MMPRPSLSLSIVSHGQGHLIRHLLADLKALQICRAGHDEILLTINIPEDEAFVGEFADLPLRVIRNLLPKGFGGNHNGAFAESKGDIFVILNPDVRLNELPVEPMMHAFRSGAGAWAPTIINSLGGVEDSARKFPTFMRLFRRAVLRQRHPDYSPKESAVEVDWVAGMVVAFPRAAFAAVQGFDERYFMYMEDADICRRLGRAGYAVVFDPSVRAIHDAQRASRHSRDHQVWHLRSALRFLTGL
jgi:N-acetylglucosaminyl-diphospho-decaprenol L-rhamnosyltransferase